jgi:CheY-like chemotaxis protein
MAILEKVSTLSDMKELMSELHRLEVKLLYDFYGVLQDFSSKKFLPQWLQKKSVNNVFVTDKGNEVLAKINKSKKFCVIIYDLETKDINGLQFLATLRENNNMKSRCKVILATPKLAYDAQSKLQHLGANALVSKPLGDDLAAAFEKIGLDY